MKQLLLLLLALSATPAFAGSVNAITLWSRKSGRYSDDANPDKLRPKSVTLEDRRLVKRRLMDVQYGKVAVYEGVALSSLLALYRPQAHDDTAVLHFANGMAVPVPLDFDAFVALTTGDAFPELPREDTFADKPDPHPITFSWNKLVVSRAARDAPFSPWRHVDTLVGVEFVNAAAYAAQFDLGEPEGQRVFAERCWFCHGARQVGANFGWDYVTPLPIWQKRTPATLLNHVKYPKAQAQELGLMMPVQKDLTAAEATALWRWMKRAAARPLPAYRP